ncbi:ABC transporter [Candidatus Dependentiae bacterium]|nr:ABC transporter [Candidatus Dependentiae bacterium]
MQSYFNSPVAYVVLCVFLFLLGYFYFSTLFLTGFASMRNFFSVAPLLLVIFGPALSMRLISEEKKAGTLESLLVLPVQDYELVLGKFLGGFGILMVGLLFTLPYIGSVAFLTPDNMILDYGPIVGGYLGLVFLASAFIALGLFASALTKNQIVAFIIGFLLCLFFFLIDKIAVFLPSEWSRFFEFLSVDTHFSNIARGVIDSRDLIYYLSLTLIFLFLTTYALRQGRQK